MDIVVLTQLADYPLDTRLRWRLCVGNLLSAKATASRVSIGLCRCLRGERVSSSGEVVHLCIGVAFDED